MALLRMQQALAAILLEPQARKAFADDPRAALEAQGVAGRDLALLATLDADDLAYFAERRNIDRLQALRADAPRAMRLLETLPGRAKPYLRAFPYSLEDPLAETDRLARWIRSAAADGSAPAALADLAAFDAAALRLAALAPSKGRASRRPSRAPGLVLLRQETDIRPFLRGDRPARAAPRRASLLALQRTEDDVLWHALDALDHELLRRADGRRLERTWLRQAAAAAKASLEQAREAAAALRREGLLRAPASGRRAGAS
jgi:hypothetical protein